MNKKFVLVASMATLILTACGDKEIVKEEPQKKQTVEESTDRDTKQKPKSVDTDNKGDKHVQTPLPAVENKTKSTLEPEPSKNPTPSSPHVKPTSNQTVEQTKKTTVKDVEKIDKVEKKPDKVKVKTETKYVPVDMDKFKKMKLGMTKEEVVKALGSGFREISKDYHGDGEVTLKEPLPVKILDYSDPLTVTDPYAWDDSVDIESIYNKKKGSLAKLRMSQEGKVTFINAVYLNPEDNKVYEYYVFEDGYVKDQSIYPFEQ